MYRLNNQAFRILRDEAERCSGKDEVSKIERQICMKRLEKLRQEKGEPADYEELRDAVIDIYPQFSEKALKQAARVNQPPGLFGKVKWVAILMTGAAGVLWVVNLPYPMIRWPVARTAPILLLPSFISMDYHYKGAINSVEQADQLVNKATSLDDIKRGAGKVKQGQYHLDNLPVWFLGYYPQAYCSLFSCTWHFTLDEFEQARRNVARMEAVVFQEENAFKSLEQAEQALQVAKQKYEQAKTVQDKMRSRSSIQKAIDNLEQIPRQTLAGEQAQTKLVAYKRDFGEFTVADADNGQTGTLIEAAKVFALQAAQASQNPPHPAQKWQQIERLWTEAINRIEDIKVNESNYLEAQKLLAQYQTNLGIVQLRRETESESKEILKQANEQIQSLIASPPSAPNQLKAEIQGVINQLKTVKPGTTAYGEAQNLLRSANNKLKQL
ncbi:hypothetical protein F7734_18220 [Scytonema sp. UIC 10036]|uniref:hypothetical protein n=1 Tax=Scytonema sp. UIC 10036 TaxID=2304196 RepID=UPI0012DA2B2B|nr:hypothetical protein [Scytonema sp. UIC 10036]MUG94217.1 hypothetical protein [Scytonema sp. UIC 10036]